jgi:hypothetical protein
MILPTRHLGIDASLVGVGAKVLAELDGQRTVSDLWAAVRDEDGVVTFDRFCLGVTFLFSVGLVELRDGRLTRRQR